MAIKGASRTSRATKKNVLVNVIATTVILIVLFVIGYFVLFYSPTKASIAELRDDIVEFDATIKTGENSQLILTALDKQLEELKAKNKRMPLFDNQPLLIDTFKEIIGEKNNWSFNPGQSGGTAANEAGGQIFRRTASLSIQNLMNYDEAMGIVRKLHGLEHRVLITGVSFNAQEPPEEGGVGNGYVGELDLNKSMISLTVDMTFLEYIPAPPKPKAPAASGGASQAEAPAVGA